MKKLLTYCAFCLLLMVPIGMQSTVFADGGGGKGGSIDLTGSTNIPRHIVHKILAEASSFWGLTAKQMISNYYVCQCMDIEQIGVNLYRVTYGSIGIQILVDSLDMGDYLGAPGE